VGGAPELAYEDTTYRVVIKDSEAGLHRDNLAIKDGDRTSVEASVSWERVAYLSAAPAKVILGSRPVRVFLRCPDESVELTDVRSAPEGIKAVVSSTRELTVRLAPDAPGVIEGHIEVATTAEGRPPLRVPVVRYAPGIRQGSQSAAR
jgi:hypothetical protein